MICLQEEYERVRLPGGEIRVLAAGRTAKTSSTRQKTITPHCKHPQRFLGSSFMGVFQQNFRRKAIAIGERIRPRLRGAFHTP